jgi:hypothetical protein
MVLVSIDPFASRRILLIVAALLCLSAACFADPVLMAQRYRTPSSSLHPARARFDLGGCAESNELPGTERADLPARPQGLLPWDGQAQTPSLVPADLSFSRRSTLTLLRFDRLGRAFL